MTIGVGTSTGSGIGSSSVGGLDSIVISGGGKSSSSVSEITITSFFFRWCGVANYLDMGP